MPAQLPYDRLSIEMIDEGAGAAHRVDILARAFANAGHDVCVRRPASSSTSSTSARSVSSQSRSARWSSARSSSVHGGPPFAESSATGPVPAGSVSARSTPDVVHVHGWEAVAAVGVRGEAAMVASLDVPASGLDAFTAALGRAYDRVIAPSSDAARELLAFGLRRDRIGVVPDGVDPARFNPGPQGPGLRADRRTPRIVCVCPALDRGILLDAMIALRRIPKARLYVAGGPPPHQIRGDAGAREVAAAARRVGVANRIFLLGEVAADRLPDLYRSADLVLCTGAEPDAARVALEAMSCAVPVAAFAQGAAVDIIMHGVSGVLVEPGNTYALANAVRGVLSSEPRRYAYAVAGLSRVQERFTWPRVAEQIEGVYRSAVADRANRPETLDALRDAPVDSVVDP